MPANPEIKPSAHFVRRSFSEGASSNPQIMHIRMPDRAKMRTVAAFMKNAA